MSGVTQDASERQRCGETTAAGNACRNYAVEDGRCRVHARRAAAQDRVAADDPGLRAGGGSVPGASGAESGHRVAGAPDATQAAATPPADPTSPSGGASDGASPSGDASDGASGAASSGARGAGAGTGEGIPVLDALAEVLGDDLGEHLATVGEFVRRRFTGDYEIDDYGLDVHLTDHVLMPLVMPLYRHWWRVASHGRDNLPDAGGLVVANHAGTLPADGLMIHVDLWEATGRHPRELGADLVFQTPVVGHFARKSGATRAGTSDADDLLGRGELVVVFPEGFKGLGKPFSQRYELQRFGRGGFVSTALRTRSPIVPTAIVGSEEIYPLLWDARQVARALGLPYFPVVAQFLAVPFVGPLGLLPLPSKWSITYGEPIATADLGPEAAEDPMVVFDLANRVRTQIQDMLTTIVMGRQTVFF